MKGEWKLGIIGCGLMGRELASAAARWMHLAGDIDRPVITAVCDVNPANCDWFVKNVPTVRRAYGDYRDLLADADVEAVYAALPHNLHRDVYIDVIRAGKHLLGEKPFGIDRQANREILEEADKHPEVFVRCSSEFPYYPGYQTLIRWIREERFGRIIEVRSGMHHSSDMDLDKPINWKRVAAVNGRYGCMGDLGIHTQHAPFRAGWVPSHVYARLSKVVETRPDGHGGTAACDTWDNAHLVCDVTHRDGYAFPWVLEAKRLSPGSTNDVYMEVQGLKGAARFSTADPNAFHFTQSWGKEQAWSRIVLGYKTMIPAITGGIFEFGFSDAMLQMLGAFALELRGKPVEFGCFTPGETRASHALQTAALLSHERGMKIPLEL